MGYKIHLIDSDFRIDSEHERDALEDVRKLTTWNDWAWMNRANPASWDYLKEAMEAWNFPIELDDDRNVVGIRFDGEKEGDEEELFRTLAPYVDDGSYLQFRGEDAEIWRYVFEGDSVERQDATMRYEWDDE